VSRGAHGTGAWATATEHIGITVADLDRSITFWTSLTGGELLSRRAIEGPHIGTLVGYPGVEIEIAALELPGGLGLEVLRDHEADDEPYDPGTAHPGNVHVCFSIDDIRRSLGTRARMRSEAGEHGTGAHSGRPHEGGLVAYFRTPDGVSIELRQAAEPI
jgi:catechol 2,3-dioxygenase-like lactoylglutathione lyase family enzyme